MNEYEEELESYSCTTRKYLANVSLRKILTMGIEDRSDKPYAERLIEELVKPEIPAPLEEFVPKKPSQTSPLLPKIEPAPPIQKDEPDSVKKSLWNKLCGIFKN